MNSKRLIIMSIVLFASLWGLAELGLGELTLAAGIPRAPILTAIGVFFLVLTRRAWHVPGSTFAMGTIAGAYKFLQHPVWGCKIAAVLTVGAVFDLGFSAYEAARANSAARRGLSSAEPLLGPVLLAPALTFAAFVLFSFFARDVLHNPFWANPSRMNEYMFVEGPIAAALSMPAALAGARASDALVRSASAWSDAGWRTYRFAALGSAMAGVAASLVFKY
jgi:hypothetical protein